MLINRAVAYCHDFILPSLRPRPATPAEREGLQALIRLLSESQTLIEALLPGAEQANAIQNLIYDAGRRHPFTVPGKDGREGVGRDWFNALYQVLLGADEGPRFGSVVAAYGIPRTSALIEAALARGDNPVPVPLRETPTA